MPNISSFHMLQLKELFLSINKAVDLVYFFLNGYSGSNIIWYVNYFFSNDILKNLLS